MCDIKIIDKETFSYKGSIIQKNDVDFWADMAGDGKKIHKIESDKEILFNFVARVVENKKPDKNDWYKERIVVHLLELINLGYKI